MKSGVVALFVAGTCAVSAGRANPQPTTDFSVEYSGPGDCPGQAEFEAGVLSRVPNARSLPPGTAEIRFRVELFDDEAGAPSVVWIELPGGTPQRREVHDASCTEAAASIVVIVSMVLDAYRSADISEPASLAEPPSSAAPPPASAEPPPPPAPRPGPKAPARPADRALAAQSNAPSQRPRFGLAAAASWESAIVSAAPIGLLAGLELFWSRPSLWSPALRLSILYTATAVEATPDGDAEFRLMTGRLSVCPLRFGAQAMPGLFACAELDAGELRGQGQEQVRNARRQSMPWLSGGAALRGELPVGKVLALEASAGTRLLLFHDRFVLDPALEVHDVPPVSVGLGVGLAARM